MQKEKENLKILIEEHRFSTNEKLDLFGYGEWVEEPDYVSYCYKNYTGQILRNQDGVFCGYVNIPKNHPWDNVPYGDIDVIIYGDLTFGEYIKQKNGNKIYCIGFDLCHDTDYVPRYKRILGDRYWPVNIFDIPRIYKNLNFVLKECQKLIDQAIEVQNEKEKI